MTHSQIPENLKLSTWTNVHQSKSKPFKIPYNEQLTLVNPSYRMERTQCWIALIALDQRATHKIYHRVPFSIPLWCLAQRLYLQLHSSVAKWRIVLSLIFSPDINVSSLCVYLLWASQVCSRKYNLDSCAGQFIVLEPLPVPSIHPSILEYTLGKH